MPSKILGMMASAKPSIITGHAQSEVATVMSQSKGGYYSSEKEVDTVVNQLEILVNNSDIAKEMGIKARSYVVSNFAKNQILDAFLEQLAQL